MTSLLKYVNYVLSDRAFVQSGLLFAVLNTAMGMLFGLPREYDGFWRAASSYIGFFVVGFLCGVAARGIYGVWRVITAFAHDNSLKVDYTAPDGCGGMHFIGDALVNFASVTLSMGILISWYLLHMHWSRSQHELVNAVMWAWVAWPFALSAFVLLAPAIEVHRTLEDAKRKEDVRLEEHIHSIEAEIEASASPPPDHIIKSYEHFNGRRAALYKMQTWPFEVRSSLKYGGVLLVNTAVTIINAEKHWKSVEEFRKLLLRNSSAWFTFF